MYRNASVPKSGVVIEKIEDEEKAAKYSKTKRTKKKSQASEDEDEDCFPIPKEETAEPECKSGVEMELDNDKQGSNKKRKAKASEQDGIHESISKSKRKKNQKEKKKQISSNTTAPAGKYTETSQVRTYPNGLVVEELSMGKPSGKKAEPGKQACVLATKEGLQFLHQWGTRKVGRVPVPRFLLTLG